MLQKNAYTYEPTKGETCMYYAVSYMLLPHYRKYVRGLPLKETDHVLDYCTGPGLLAKELAKRLPEGSLHVADVSETWLRITVKRLAGYNRLYSHRLETLDELIGGGGLDKVICHFVLHEFPKKYQKRAVQQLVDNLRPGGELYIREPVSEHHGVGADWLTQFLNEVHIEIRSRKEGRAALLGAYVDLWGIKQIEDNEC
jgi:ubiquinone/menaquinone biosynthesis C-methylase UbiE